ncbi:MAG TPA: biotin synthase BioB [Myxococcota bacterium]|nr:biotin synthase BioB [Myxococcota bacterium]
MLDWNAIRARGLAGISLTDSEAAAICELSTEDELAELISVANAVRVHHKGDLVNTCGITNAKSGACPEKCSFCSQSAHFQDAQAPVYGMKDAETIVAEAQQAAANGVREFSIVTQGRAVTRRDEIETLKQSFSRIRESTGMQTCASIGLVDAETLAELQAAGMDSVHHNLETARSFHPQIVETHSYDDEVETIRAGKALGMYVCSGGIFGMGESWAQRVELAVELRELGVDSVPLNFLNPRPGTPLEDLDELTPFDCLKIIALYRLVLPTKDLIVCGGRQVQLRDRQVELFDAGANGIMLGDYLTTKGTATALDMQILEDKGLVVRPTPHTPTAPVVTN